MRVRTGIIYSDEGELTQVNNDKYVKMLNLNMVEHDVKSIDNFNEHGIKEEHALGKSMDFSTASFVKDKKYDQNRSALNITHDNRNGLNENKIVKNFTQLVPRIRSIYNSTKPQVPKFNFPSLNLILKQASKGLGDFFLNIATNISVESIVNQSDLNIAEQSKRAINIEALTKVQIPSTPNSINEKIRNDNPQIFSNQDRMLYSTAVKNPPPKITYRRKLVTTQQASNISNSEKNNNTNSNNVLIEPRRPYAQRARNKRVRYRLRNWR
jgi:hypothetical protein